MANSFNGLTLKIEKFDPTPKPLNYEEEPLLPSSSNSSAKNSTLTVYGRKRTRINIEGNDTIANVATLEGYFTSKTVGTLVLSIYNNLSAQYQIVEFKPIYRVGYDYAWYNMLLIEV